MINLHFFLLNIYRITLETFAYITLSTYIALYYIHEFQVCAIPVIIHMTLLKPLSHRKSRCE